MTIRPTTNLQLLLEASKYGFEVVQLNVRKEHAVEAYEEVGEASLGYLSASLRLL